MAAQDPYMVVAAVTSSEEEPDPELLQQRLMAAMASPNSSGDTPFGIYVFSFFWCLLSLVAVM